MLEDWKDWFSYGESPYFAMFRAGQHGIPLEDVSAWCHQLGIPLRDKDVRNWSDGKWRYDCRHSANRSVLNPILPSQQGKLGVNRAPFLDMKLSEFPSLPEGWTGTDHRWFPCNEDNKPMQKWGYSESYIPQLYDHASAVALSTCGYVGQNMYAQPFIVVDIDGVGHGVIDQTTIDFGRQFDTQVWENPEKAGSFHLYFWTDRLLPIQHWPFAHIDFMGNAKNAAVYLKKKKSNGKEMAYFSQQTLSKLQEYIRYRERNKNVV